MNEEKGVTFTGLFFTIQADRSAISGQFQTEPGKGIFYEMKPSKAREPYQQASQAFMSMQVVTVEGVWRRRTSGDPWRNYSCFEIDTITPAVKENE